MNGWGEQEAETEDDAEKGGMLWEEANSCMFLLPHVSEVCVC